MTTRAKIAANRQNARRSTGPKTAAGKATSSRNATRHGLLSKQVILPDEDEATFDKFWDDMLVSLAPEGRLEALLAERVIINAWRLRRGPRFESGMLAYQMWDARAEGERLKANDGEFDPLGVRDRGGHGAASDTARTAAETAEAERDADQVVAAVVRDATGANMLAKLSRYETTLDRGMYRALHDLDRRQADRAG